MKIPPKEYKKAAEYWFQKGIDDPQMEICYSTNVWLCLILFEFEKTL